MEMEAQQQENEEEITDDYRPTTNGSDTTATSTSINENGDSNGAKGDADGTTSLNAATSTTAPSVSFAPNSGTSLTMEPHRKYKIKLRSKKEQLISFCLFFFLQPFACRGHQRCDKKILINFCMIRGINLLVIRLLVTMKAWRACRNQSMRDTIFCEKCVITYIFIHEHVH